VIFFQALATDVAKRILWQFKKYLFLFLEPSISYYFTDWQCDERGTQ